MKNLFFSMVFLLANLSMMTAQDFYLPASPSSEIAKVTYYETEQLASQIQFKESDKELDTAKVVLEKHITLLPNEANIYNSMTEYYDETAMMGMDNAKERSERIRAALKNNK